MVFKDKDMGPVLLYPDTESLFTENRTIKNMIEYAPDGNKSVVEELKKLGAA